MSEEMKPLGEDSYTYDGRSGGLFVRALPEGLIIAGDYMNDAGERNHDIGPVVLPWHKVIQLYTTILVEEEK